MPKKRLNTLHSDKRLVRNVALTLACKIAFIACLGFLFFGSGDRVSTDAETMSQVLLSTDKTPTSVSTHP